MATYRLTYWESPANQLRILDEQWSRFTRSVGNVFLPLLAKILPYLNAILMVLTEIISQIAVFFGYNPDDYDFFASTNENMFNFDENIKQSDKDAKKLKQTLRGFDRLNNITTPTDTSSGIGTNNKIDNKLLEAFNKAFDDYQSKLDNVEMKATKIRDRIMEWLGFTKKTNLLTGEVSWEYGGIQKTFKSLLDSFIKMSPSAKLVVGGIVTLAGVKIYNGISKLVSKFGEKTGL